jgi:hypothetical protein
MGARMGEIVLVKLAVRLCIPDKLKWCDREIGNCLEGHIKTNATAWGSLECPNIAKMERNDDLQMMAGPASTA